MQSMAETADKRMDLLRQVLSSRTFAKSARLARFLEFICLRALDGKAQEINEQQIGIHVFARSPHYVASEDSIVRAQARLLRLKLEEYFEHEAPNAPMIIAIPKGGYVPVFEPRHPVAVVEAPMERLPLPAELEPVIAVEEHGGAMNRSWGLGVIAACVLFLLSVLGVHLWSRTRGGGGPSHALWSSIFAPGQRAILVPSDDALVLYQELIQVPVPLEAYLNGSYLEQFTPHIGKAALTSNWFADHQYTSTADLNLALRLGRLPEALASDVETRNARVLRLDDLKSANVVLIGGIGANPWVGLFAEHLNFDVNYDWKTSEGYVLNKHPQNGVASMYRESVSDGFRRSYGVLAYLPGLGDSGNTLHREHILRYARIYDQIASDVRYAGCLGWCAFDYQTHADFGSGDHICYHGVMDTFREPKPAAGFYRSQCSPQEEAVLEPGFHFAENDRPGGFKDEVICSNCDEIRCSILHQGVPKQIAVLKPNREEFPHLAHPPFFLTLPDGNDDWGDLRMDGYLDGKLVISKTCSAKGIDQRFTAVADDTELIADGSDATRVALRVTDEYGMVRPLCHDPISITLEGPATLLGESLASLSSGVTAVWVRATATPGTIKLTARHNHFGEQTITIVSHPAAKTTSV